MPDTPVKIRVTQRERQAVAAFRRGEPLTEIAACLGVTPADADAWLDSDRLFEVCQAMRTKEPTRRGRSPKGKRK